jgi:hypothetical protein
MTEQERLAAMHCPGHKDMAMVCEICAANEMKIVAGEERAKIIAELKVCGFEDAVKSLEAAITISGC